MALASAGVPEDAPHVHRLHATHGELARTLIAGMAEAESAAGLGAETARHVCGIVVALAELRRRELLKCDEGGEADVAPPDDDLRPVSREHRGDDDIGRDAGGDAEVTAALSN